jgi:glucose/mannose transport system permease protein
VVAPSFVLGLPVHLRLMAWNGYLSVSAHACCPTTRIRRAWSSTPPVGERPLVGGAEEPGHLRRAVRRRRDGHRPAAGDLLDQKVRAEGVLRTIYLYPMALSFIVTGTAWKWILNPAWARKA